MTTKEATPTAPAPTMDDALRRLIKVFELKLEAKRAAEAEKAAEAKRAIAKRLEALEAGAAEARREFEALDEQVRQVVAVLERANLGDEIERHIAKTMSPHQLANFQRLRSLASATVH